MRIERKTFLAISIVLISVCLSGSAWTDQGETTIRWDLISADAQGNLKAGGQDSAADSLNSILTLTGSGTFEPGEAEEVTGGGTWTLGTSSGKYQVTSLVRFTLAPCTVPTCVSGFGGTDLVGNEKDARAGLVVLRLKYSDGDSGVLMVSCNLNGTPLSVFEGIIASKGSVTFWNQAPNAANNATIFHMLHREEH
jgi:hypothetical protein